STLSTHRRAPASASRWTEGGRVADFDLVIRGGTVIDGSGAPGRTADVAITGDAIVAIGEVRGRGEAELDAGGLAVAPGFIDVHAHDDAAVVRDPRVDFKVMQGVTTDVVGNCGAGVAPVASPGFRDAYPRAWGAILGPCDLPWSTTAEYFAAVD